MSDIDLGWTQEPTTYAFFLTTAALVLSFFRLIRGPSLPDRVIALDLMAVIAVGIIATFSIARDKPFFLEVAAVLSLVVFVGTIAFARYLERSVGDE